MSPEKCAAAYDVDGRGDDRGCAGFTCVGNKRRQNVASGEGRTVHLQKAYLVIAQAHPLGYPLLLPAVFSAPA